MKIFVNDYGGYPFPFQLSKALSKREYGVIHAYCDSLAGTPQADFKSEAGCSVDIHPIRLDKVQQKTSFIKRRKQDIEYGRKCSQLIAENRPDVVVSANTPLDAQRQILAICREQHIPFVYWWQDVIGLAIDSVLRRKLPILGHQIGMHYRRMEQRMIELSDHVVPIADRFAELLVQWKVPPHKYTVISNWAPIENLPSMAKDNAWSRSRGLHNRFVFMYSGTLSLKHNPQLLLDLAMECGTDGSDGLVVVRSTGSGADTLRKAVAENAISNLLIEDFGPFTETPSAFASADVLVAILEPEAGAYSVPSKVLAYLCAGRPLLLAVPLDNAASEVVTKQAAGYVSEPTDHTKFLMHAKLLSTDSHLREKMGAAARSYAEQTFGIDQVADRFEAVLQATVKKVGSTHRK